MNQSTEAVAPTVETAQKLGLLPEEFDRICEILGRTPNFTELSIFSVMWSEHCSYKNSITYLKKLPREGSAVLVEAGEENAGLVDIGDGRSCAFKIESHNHPSALEPYQGAATGVGGIHRDIFTMGARPIAALNSLRFGDPSTKRTKHLMRGVVSGIGDYGNCLGVPTVGGEVYFDPCYEQNILVNAMSVGILEAGQDTVSAIAEGVGNPVFIVGSATGKDGIHGATFASADLTEDSANDLPAVQVGDPFQEKLLLEASLEAITTGAIVGMQDMGAAGITCSTSEMSAKGNAGMVINLNKVPTRQSDMQPFEILLSESQERMLIVCHKGQEDKLLAVFEKWNLECEHIGEVTDTGRLHYYHHGELVADVPAYDLVLGGGAPIYDREFTRPTYMDDLISINLDETPKLESINTALKQVFKSPNIVSKRWIYDQYDGTVRTNSLTNTRPCDSAVIRIKGSTQGLSMTVDCNSTYVHADPYKGGLIAVSEAARNIVASGSRPLAITNCLNFGNPYNPEVYYQFVNALKGMGEACALFDTPVTGGNVSFYNHTTTDKGAVPVNPTPTIGMIGLMADATKLMTLDFKSAGDIIILVGENRNDINCSLYARDVLKLTKSIAPHIDINEEKKHQEAILNLIEDGLCQSVHDISDGGLTTALLECAMPKQFGFTIETGNNIHAAAALFGESQGRYVISCKPAHLNDVKLILGKHHTVYEQLGTVTGDKKIEINNEACDSISEWSKIYNNTLQEIIEK